MEFFNLSQIGLKYGMFIIIGIETRIYFKRFIFTINTR